MSIARLSVDILHNHKWVKKSCIVLVAGKIYDIDFMGYSGVFFFQFPRSLLGSKITA